MATTISDPSLLSPPGATPTDVAPKKGGTATRRRAKSFLRNYYGIQQADPSGASQETSTDNATSMGVVASKADPFDIDSHSFQVDKYMHKMFVEKQLPGLVKSDNELVADIRQLDGDMKTLVYENYSKFLSATDTINRMKSNVENLESEMSRLTRNITKIASSSSDINSSLGGKREKIRQLNGVHSLLTKLQFVFELPTNLNQCLETQSYTQAVRSYCRTLHLLQYYKHLAVFTGIERECKAIMVTVAVQIRQKMCSETASGTEISECVGLLLALKEDPVALWKQYLELSLAFLAQQYQKSLDAMEELPIYVPQPKTTKSPPPATPKRSPSSKKVAKTPTTPRSKDITSATGGGEKGSKSGSVTPGSAPVTLDKVSYLNRYYLKQVEEFVVSFRNYFLVSATPESSHEGMASTTGIVTEGATQKPAWVAKETRTTANLTKEQQTTAGQQVRKQISKSMTEYLATVNSLLEFPEDILTLEPMIHVQILQHLYNATVSSKGLCQLVDFDLMSTGLIQKWERHLAERALDLVRVGLVERIKGLDSEEKVVVVVEGQEKEKEIEDGGLSVSLPDQQPRRSNSSMAEDDGYDLAGFMYQTRQWFQVTLTDQVFPFVESFLALEVRFLETKSGKALFLENFQNGFRGFWNQILKDMKTITQQSLKSVGNSPGGGGGRDGFGAHGSLVVSQLCFEFSSSLVEQVYKNLSKSLFRPGKRLRAGSFSIDTYADQPVTSSLQPDCKLIIGQCQESGHLFLDYFVERIGKELSWLVMEDLNLKKDQFMKLPSPPTKVSESWQLVCQRLAKVESQVIAVYGDDGERPHGGGGGGGGGLGAGVIGPGVRDRSSESNRHDSIYQFGSGTASHRNDSAASYGNRSTFLPGGGGGGGSTSKTGGNNNNRLFSNSQQQRNLMSNIDKLFSDRVEIFGRCQDLNRTGIMFGMVKILLKAFTESVRMNTFSKGGFQQVQVDAEFAKIWLWRFVTADEKWMYTILEEAQQTAFQRCIDPQPLEFGVVESILATSSG